MPRTRVARPANLGAASAPRVVPKMGGIAPPLALIPSSWKAGVADWTFSTTHARLESVGISVRW